jgi:hypothetical protein
MRAYFFVLSPQSCLFCCGESSWLILRVILLQGAGEALRRAANHKNHAVIKVILEHWNPNTSDMVIIKTEIFSFVRCLGWSVWFFEDCVEFILLFLISIVFALLVDY